jgi:hypothetical protein
MAKPMFDQNALIEMFENATAKGGEQLRQAVGNATLQALQGREMTLGNIRGALKQVSEAASMGAAKNLNPGIDVEALLDKAVAGMDDALLKAVEAHRAALNQFAIQGADFREKQLKKALSDLEKMEDTLFAALKKTAEGVGSPVAGAWGQVLERMQAGGTLSGAQAATTAEQLLGQVQTGMREGRAASLRAAQALAEGYSAMVSGVLLGMSEALKQGSAGGAPAKGGSRRK